MQQALAINPLPCQKLVWRCCGRRGDQGVKLNEQSRDRDPLYLPTAENIGWDYMVLGMEPAMAAHLEKVRVQFAAISDSPVQAAETMLAYMRADYAGTVEALRLEEDSRGLFNLLSAMALMQLGEPEWAAQVGAGTPAEITALATMGQLEESKMVAQRRVAGGEGIWEFIGALVSSERYAETVEFFDQRWSSLAAFEEQVVVRGLSSGVVVGRLVEALRATGDEARAEQFLARYGEILEEMDEQGVNNHWFTFSRAYHATLLGDDEQALEQLAIFADSGHFMPPDFTRQWRSFEFLRGDPRFDELLTQMTQRLNEQRAELDLPAYKEAQRG